MRRQEGGCAQRNKEQREEIQPASKRQVRRMEKQQKCKSSNDDRLAPALRGPAKKNRQGHNCR